MAQVESVTYLLLCLESELVGHHDPYRHKRGQYVETGSPNSPVRQQGQPGTPRQLDQGENGEPGLGRHELHQQEYPEPRDRQEENGDPGEHRHKLP